MKDEAWIDVTFRSFYKALYILRLGGKKCLYLSQSVPVCDGLPWVSQHFVPVISSETLSFWPGVTHTDHLIMSNPVSSKTHIYTYVDPHSKASSSQTDMEIMTKQKGKCIFHQSFIKRICSSTTVTDPNSQIISELHYVAL